MPRALLLTVGTGDINRLEESLLTPLRKSIDQGERSRVILLPSLVTEQNAAELKARCGDDPIDIAPLPAPDAENDADRCFAHFDQAISELRAAGFAPADIVVDYTRGTKAMSAALVLAAIRHDLPTLRYITGERDNRGTVKPGSERIFETDPAIAMAQKQLDTALQFVRRGNFAGALALIGDGSVGIGPWPSVIAEALPAIRAALDFYAAWDRLDYAAAARVTDRNHSVLIHGFEAVGPDDDAPLRELYTALEDLLVRDAGEAVRQHLGVARSLEFSAR